MPKRVVNRVRELLSVKERKKKRRLNLKEIGEATGLTPKTVHQWLNNKVTRFDETALLAFAEFLGCDVGDLLTIIEETEEDALGNIKAALTV